MGKTQQDADFSANYFFVDLQQKKRREAEDLMCAAVTSQPNFSFYYKRLKIREIHRKIFQREDSGRAKGGWNTRQPQWEGWQVAVNDKHVFSGPSVQCGSLRQSADANKQGPPSWPLTPGSSIVAEHWPFSWGLWGRRVSGSASPRSDKRWMWLLWKHETSKAQS